MGVVIRSVDRKQVGFFPELLRPVVDFLLSYEPIQKIVLAVLKEGPFVIGTSTSLPSASSWSLRGRVLAIRKDETQSGFLKVVSHFVFELLNASNSGKFKDLLLLASQKKMDKETFVRNIETIEFNNGHQCKKILNQAIAEHRLPEGPLTDGVFKDFELHYKYQQLIGHTEQIVSLYERVCPDKGPSIFKGAWTYPPPDSRKATFLELLHLKSNLLDAVGEIKEKLEISLGTLIAFYLTKNTDSDESIQFFLSLNELFGWKMIFDCFCKVQALLYMKLPRLSSSDIPIDTLAELKEKIGANKNQIAFGDVNQKKAGIKNVGENLNIYLMHYLDQDLNPNDLFLRLRGYMTWKEIFHSISNER